MSSNDGGDDNENEQTIAKLESFLDSLSLGVLTALIGLIRRRFPFDQPLQVVSPALTPGADPLGFTENPNHTVTVDVTFNRPYDPQSVNGTVGTVIFSGNLNPGAVALVNPVSDVQISCTTPAALDQIAFGGPDFVFSIRLVGTDVGGGTVRDLLTQQPLDGDYDGTPGGDYTHTFIRVG